MISVNTRLLSALIAVFILLISTSAVSAATTYYNLDESITTPIGMTLETFKVSSDSPELYVGDEITAVAMMSYYSSSDNQIIIDTPGGIYFEVTAPNGTVIKLGSNYIGRIVNSGDYTSIKESFIPDYAGVWKIAPAYSVISNSGLKKCSQPKNWTQAEFTVLGRAEPKPDLVIENVDLEYDSGSEQIKRISYLIKNIGDADSQASVSYIFINGEKSEIESNVGYIPAGESLTIFVPLNIKYSGSSSTLDVLANGDSKIDESDLSNNNGLIIKENPKEVTQTSSANSQQSHKFQQSAENPSGLTGGSIGEQVTYISADSCLPYTGNCNMAFTCAIMGILSILLCIVTFALGYYYGVSRNCKREMIWMREKIDALRATGSTPSEKGEFKDLINEAAEDFVKKHYGEDAKIEKVSEIDEDSKNTFELLQDDTKETDGDSGDKDEKSDNNGKDESNNSESENQKPKSKSTKTSKKSR